MRFRILILVSLALGLSGGVAAQRSGSSCQALLRAATDKEVVDGDLHGAVKLHQVAFDRCKTTDRAAAAQALLGMAGAYRGLGSPEALTVYQRVVTEFPLEKEAVAKALSQMAAMRVPAQAFERLWSGPAIASPAGTPTFDGRYMTFVDQTEGSFRLALLDLTSHERTRLTTALFATAIVESAAPSQDGTRIAYGWVDKKGGGQAEFTWRIIGADGRGVRVVAKDDGSKRLVAWSPDGRFLAAVHGRDDGTYGVVLISTIDGTIHQLVSGAAVPAIGGFSPDSRWLSYALSATPKNPGGIFAITTDALHNAELVRGPAKFGRPLWTPDGRRLVFTSDRSSTSDLWSLEVLDGRPIGEVVVVQKNVGAMGLLGFTRQGSLYYTTRSSDQEAFTADIDPATLSVSNVRPVSDRIVGHNSDPELSPDNSMVAFVREQDGGRVAMVRSMVTGEERSVARLGERAYRARVLQWFPDGRSILLTDVDRQRVRFRRVDALTNEERVVFSGAWNVWSASLSADGQTLFYSIAETDKLRLIRRQLETGEETELHQTDDTSSPGHYGLSASPDGTRLVYALNTRGGGRSLYVTPANGGQTRPIHQFTSEAAGDWIVPEGAIAWTNDSRQVVFTGTCGRARAAEDQLELCAVAADGGPARSVAEGRPFRLSRMISRDGRRIAFTALTQSTEVWVARNLLTK